MTPRYAVIFTAELADTDAQYTALSSQLRQLALERYHCLAFTSCSESGQEVAISYWQEKQHIQAWKEDALHRQAQALGRSRWYRSYQVQLVEVLHAYRHPMQDTDVQAPGVG